MLSHEDVLKLPDDSYVYVSVTDENTGLGLSTGISKQGYLDLYKDDPNIKVIRALPPYRSVQDIMKDS